MTDLICAMLASALHMNSNMVIEQLDDGEFISSIKEPDHIEDLILVNLCPQLYPFPDINDISGFLDGEIDAFSFFHNVLHHESLHFVP
jgi:hypothetical protein